MHAVLRAAAAALGAWLIAAWPCAAATILFVGNSFTFGALSPVEHYRSEAVTDLNGGAIGGVPALFKTFAEQTGEDWTVSLETSPGKDLAFHLEHKRALIGRPWDVVVLQGHSLLDPSRPGDPTRHLASARALGELVRQANPKARVSLVSTWSRADQTYLPSGRWHGQPIERMAVELAAANQKALGPASPVAGVIPVGAAWNRAMALGVADPNPYDGVAPGKLSLWAEDHYHASAEGSYLAALVIFGAVTGVDPRTLGDKERAATDLRLAPGTAGRLQSVAAAELGFR
jgi:hypothetical protein